MSWHARISVSGMNALLGTNVTSNVVCSKLGGSLLSAMPPGGGRKQWLHPGGNSDSTQEGEGNMNGSRDLEFVLMFLVINKNWCFLGFLGFRGT